MVWQVAVVLDSETQVSGLLGMMPVWAQTTPDRKAAALELWAAWNPVWEPDAGFTLWTNPSPGDVLERLLDEIPMIELHHPNLVCLRLFGVPESESLVAEMAVLGYLPISGATFPGRGFARSSDNLRGLRELVLEAGDWNSADDFYNALFQAVGAPDWHGRNLDALIDSIQTGRINQIEVPYRILVRNPPPANSEVKSILNDFADLVQYMQSNGCPVSLLIQE